MKVMLTIALLALLALLALAAPVPGGDAIEFQTANEPDGGRVSAFELKMTNRAILKIADNDYLILELMDAKRDGEWEVFTEACSISWTLITSRSIQVGTARSVRRYRSKETNATFPARLRDAQKMRSNPCSGGLFWKSA